jgi:superfamily II DNA or RNA helicase
MLVVAQSGPTLAKVTNKFLVEQGYSDRPKITFLHNPAPLRPGLLLEYSEAQQTLLYRNENRYEAMRAVIEASPHKATVVAFNDIAHGEDLYQRLCDDFPNLRITLAHGDHPQRKANMEAYKRGEADVLVVSTIMKEGLNMPRIQRLFYCIGGKSTIWVKQFLGRATRRSEEGEVEVYDFWDEGKYVSAHSEQRMKIYRKQEFDIAYAYEATKTGRPKKAKVLSI